ncbi:MAG: hypothetical protein A2Y61_03950 [Chloroflexi bacterium RBG_13_60_13]|nr:MAG: hypothetical protein A2Y61_03950 [Chloroflexi bacterium RBG_13_60_13]
MTDDELLLFFSFASDDPFVGAPLAAAFDPVEAHVAGELAPSWLPPIAGAAPGTPWEWAWDRVQDILEGAWDLAEKVGRMFADLLQGVWEWVGGAIRFVYEWLDVFQQWVSDSLSDIWGDLRSHVTAARNWIRDRVEDAADWMWNVASDAQGNFWDGISGAFRWTRDRVNAARDWLRERIWDISEWLRDQVNAAAEWVKATTDATAYWLRDQVNAAAAWIWETAQDAEGYFWGGLSGAFRWLWGRVDDAAFWLRDRVLDAADWTRNQVLSPIMGAFSDIGEALHDAIDLIGGVIMDAAEFLGQLIVDALRWPWEHIAEPFLDTVERKLAIPGKLIRGEYSDFGAWMDDVMDPPILMLAGVFGVLILVQVIGLAVGLAFETFVTPMALPYQQDAMARVGAALLTVGVVQEALNRGFIDEATADRHLSRQGYSGDAKRALLELRNLLPSPSDLIRMAVREVFNPALREALTLEAEYPEAFTPFARQLGYSEEWALNYWCAHWDLPSVSQGMEMLHRGEIEMPELENLIKALDYAPVWRQPLINIAYNPITRVDLRRLYKLEIITEEQVFQGYKDLGYNDERARWLTDFTKQYANPDDASQLDDLTDLAASTIRASYRRHVISRDEALDKLVDTGMTEDLADFYLAIDDAQLALDPTTDAGVPIRELTRPIIVAAYREKVWSRERAQQELETLGYLPWAADLFLQLEDLAEERELAELEEAVVKEEYIKRVIDRAQAASRLDALGAGPERRDLLLRRWDLQAARKTRELTVAQVQRGLKDGAFSEAEVLSRFAGLGFNDVDAKFLVDITDTTPEGTARRLSAAQLSQAYKAQAITDAQFLSALLGLGYSQADAEVLVDIATPAPAAKVRQLSGAQLAAGFRAGLLTESELLERLTAAGYAQADAELLRDIAAQRPDPPARKLSVAQLKELYKAETLDKAGLLAELLILGYTERDAGWIRDLIAPAETTE